MDLYTVFKFLHVVTAIAWVGGGLTLLVANVIATRLEGEAAAFKVLDIMNLLGKSWFVPTSFLTIIFGAIATTLGGMWGELWVILGLAGFASTFFTGLLFIEPQGRRIGAALASGQVAEAQAAGRNLMQIARFDYTVMLAIIIDMVFRPGWTDFVVLALMALVVVSGAIVFLGLGLRDQPTVA
jgi:hypothetical protein